MRESGFSFCSATTRCIVLFLLLWSLGSPAAEAQEAEALFRFFRATPPWAAEAPGVARARFGLGLDVFFERQESLRIASQEKTLRLRDLPSGREETELLREDPRLLNRKFDILLELEGGGSELSVPLPDVPILGLSPSLVFQAAAADVHLDFLDRNRAADSTSYDGRGSLFGTGLDLTASLCRSCPWFAGASYRFQKIPRHGVDRSPGFRPDGFEILEDETRLGREVHEISTRAGYSFPGNRIASYVGVRHRSTTVQIDDELRYRDPLARTETHISTRSKLDSDTTLALAGLEAHLGGPFYARIDAALGDEDRVVWANVAYLVPRKRVRTVKEELIWPTLAELLEHGPRFYQWQDLVAGFGVVAGGWPVVVEFELEKEGFLVLTVTTQGGVREELRLPNDGQAKGGERRVEIRTLKAEFDELQPAMFSIEAFTSPNQNRPVKFSLHSLGAGRETTASARRTLRNTLQPGLYLAQALPVSSAAAQVAPMVPAISQVFLTPRKINVSKGEQADYQFRSGRFFRRVKVTFHLLQPNAFSIPAREIELRCAPVNQGEVCKGTWDGLNNNNKISEGVHTLQAYVWKGAVEEDWSFAVASGGVKVVRR